MASSPAPSGAAATGYVPAIFAGLVASLVGIGLARFGYTPLLPVMIHAQDFTKTANCWGIDNNRRGTNSNRIVVLRRP